MENNFFLRKLLINKNLIIFATVITAVLVLGISLLQPLKYKSTISLLVVQETPITTDSYSLMRSNEYLSSLLSKVAYSTTFADKVFASSDITKSYFGSTPKNIAKNWNKSLEVKTIPESGIISITAYHTNRAQAEKLAMGVSSVLMATHADYHGLGDQVKIKLLDAPITSNWPVKPNLILNLFLGLLLGFAGSIAWLYFFDNNSNIKINDNNNFAPHLVGKAVAPESFNSAVNNKAQQTEVQVNDPFAGYYPGNNSMEHLLNRG